MRQRVNGTEIAFDLYGEVGRPWVVLVHGFPFARAYWDGQVAALRDRYRVLTWDLRGLGESAMGPLPQPLEAYVDDLFGLMEALGVERPALVGLSMGGYIALRAVERAPQRFRALVLCDTRSAPDDDAGKLARAAGIKALHASGREEFLAAMLPKLFHDPASPAARGLLALMHRNDPAAMANALAAMQGRTDTTPALASFALPTLVLVGRDDTLTPPALSESLAARIPGAELAILDGAGHCSNLEAPEAFNAALATFLDRVISH